MKREPKRPPIRVQTTPPLPETERCVGRLGSVRYIVRKTAARFLAVRVTGTSRRLLRDCGDYFAALQCIIRDAEQEIERRRPAAASKVAA